MNCMIGLDIGTSAVKGVLMTKEGEILKHEEKCFAYLTPAACQKVIEAGDYLSVCLNVLKTLAEALPEQAKIISICQASASGNLLLLDKNNKPLTPIFNWQDNRVTDEVNRVLGELDLNEIYETVGWPLGNTFPLAQLCWLKCRQPELLSKAAHIVMSTEYLNYILTGKLGIAPSAGTPFYLIDQRKNEYYQPFLKRLGVSEEKLPPIFKTGTVLGGITKEASDITGIAAGTPVVLGTFDHPSAAIAAGVTNEGQMLLSCGTSWVMFYPVAKREKAVAQKLLIDPFLSPEGCWGAMSSLTSVSEKINGYVERYISKDSDRFKELDLLASMSKKGANGLRINPLLGENEAEIRSFPKSDIARAIMEGIASLLKENMERLEKGGICASSIVMAGGPSESAVWPKVISEVLGKEVFVCKGAFSGAVGAAKIGEINFK